MSADTAELLQLRAQEALANFVEIRVGDDGTLGFEYAGALCSLRAVTLAPGLDVLAVTCVLAWDRLSKPVLHKRVADRNAQLQFGSISVIGHNGLVDVILRYTFPAAGLEHEALTTMLLLVLSGADQARQGLLP